MLLQRLGDILYTIKQRVSIDFRKYLVSPFSYLYIKIYVFFILVVNCAIWFMARYIDSNTDTEQIALHYNVDFGIDYYGNIRELYIIPILGIIILLINFFLVTATYSHIKQRLISHILFGTALAVNIILLSAIFSVYLVNFR